MLYDPMTVWYFAIFIMVVLASVIFLSWLFMQEESALAWWGMSLLLVTAGISGVAARGQVSDFISIELANALIIFANLCGWTGFRFFEGRRPLWGFLIAGPLAWIVLCQLPVFQHSVFMRSLLMSTMVGAGMCAAIYELWRGRHEHMIARTAAIAVLAGHALLTMIRPLMLGSMADSVSRTGVLLRDPYLVWYAHEWLAFLVIMTFIVVALVRERRELVLQHASMIDDLTGLLNRRGFMARSVRLCRPDVGVALLALDLDNFKAVNDRHGHAGGDRLLALFAEVLRSQVRASDVVARIGGEEFGVMMPDAGSEAALAVAERIRRAFREATHSLGMDGIAGTVSIGVVSGIIPAGGFPESIGPMLARADSALYRAKALGRNRVELFETSEVAAFTANNRPRQDRRA